VVVDSSADPVRQSVLVHDPVGLDALGSSPLVEHQRLLHADLAHAADAAGRRGRRRVDGLVRARRLPVTRRSRAVGASAVRVLAVPRAEEVPLALPEDGFA